MVSLSTLHDMTSFCQVEFPAHVQKQQQMRLNKKINRLSIFMYNPRAHMRIIYISHHARIQKFLPNSDNVLLWGERLSKKHLKPAIIGLPAKRHLNGVSLTGMGRWWPNIESWLDIAFWFSAGPDQYCLETLYFCDFSGGVRTPCIRAWATKFWYLGLFVKDSFIHGCTAICSGASGMSRHWRPLE